ncbi:GNAT family N-acetyltransferase [Bifidobacterium oedipodis]|uniref:GCN5 family acetyltransferase n=1 Tax=Bifidobacterium oedipodis TaxID=2675322 RepID=A0A7Y0HSX2_9BIFI|nr:GNAT family N-acetyltransferase [Bifidobacterium sp. DSM 109957]NMM93497.1 GCN5 family acetyltransferase [Bifidobacterium sp. DSM 109957]
MNLEMLRLCPTQDFETPFGYDVDGFTERWWHGSLTAQPLEEQRGNDYWSFGEEGNEIVRAWIETSTLDDSYIDFTPPEVVTDIAFFEVREKYRRRGYGTKAVEMLMMHYRKRLITSFPVDAAADSFWCSVGFIYHPRKDGADCRNSTTRRYDPLYVFDNRQD